MGKRETGQEAQSEVVLQFLRALLQTHEKLQELAVHLRSQLEVKTVKVYSFVPEEVTRHHWDERQQKKIIGSDFGVSAELHDGAVVDWWLEIWYGEESGWDIAANIFESDRDKDGCHKIAEFDEQHSLALEATMQRLADATAWLVANESKVGGTKSPEQAYNQTMDTMVSQRR